MRSRNFIMTFLFTLNGIVLYASSDSINFSKNGKYVLETSVDNNYLNSCPCNYWLLYQQNVNESIYCVVFTNDSVYFLYYDTISSKKNYFKINQCRTNAKVYKTLSSKDFDNEYQITLPSKTSLKTVVFKTDTLKTRKVQYYEYDSTLYYDIHATAYLNDEIIVDETISTNGPAITYNYKVYYSIDEKYYFVTGQYSFSEKTRNDFELLESYSSKSLCKIGKNKDNNH